LSRVANDPLDLPKAADEALLAANVAETTPDCVALAFDETGAYRLLLSAMSEDPGELQRFYSETVEPLVAYDEQYETSQLVRALALSAARFAHTGKKLFGAGVYLPSAIADREGVKSFHLGRDGRRARVGWLGVGRVLAGIVTALCLMALGLTGLRSDVLGTRS